MSLKLPTLSLSLSTVYCLPSTLFIGLVYNGHRQSRRIICFDSQRRFALYQCLHRLHCRDYDQSQHAASGTAGGAASVCGDGGSDARVHPRVSTAPRQLHVDARTRFGSAGPDPGGALHLVDHRRTDDAHRQRQLHHRPGAIGYAVFSGDPDPGTSHPQRESWRRLSRWGQSPCSRSPT